MNQWTMIMCHIFRMYFYLLIYALNNKGESQAPLVYMSILRHLLQFCQQYATVK